MGPSESSNKGLLFIQYRNILKVFMEKASAHIACGYGAMPLNVRQFQP